MIDSKCQKIIEKIAKKQTKGTRVFWEDAAQVAYMKVCQAVKAGKFQGGAIDFQHWTATVAKFAIIDLVRKETKISAVSLDCNIPGTNIPLIETVADRLDLMNAVERADLLLRIENIVLNLNKRFPKKQYLALYRRLSEGKKMTEIAKEQGITQGGISKRKWELIKLIAEELGLFEVKHLKQFANQTSFQKTYRSDRQW